MRAAIDRSSEVVTGAIGGRVAEGAGDITRGVAMRRDVASRARRAGRYTPLCVHRDFRVRARHDAGVREPDHACINVDSADRIDWDNALAGRGGVRIGRRAERLPGREIHDGVHDQVVVRAERDAEITGVVGLAPLHGPRVRQAYQAVAAFVPKPAARPSWKVLRPVTI
jgi:hypothetical protein